MNNGLINQIKEDVISNIEDYNSEYDVAMSFYHKLKSKIEARIKELEEEYNEINSPKFNSIDFVTNFFKTLRIEGRIAELKELINAPKL